MTAPAPAPTPTVEIPTAPAGLPAPEQSVPPVRVKMPELGVDMPITFAVNAVLWEGASKDEVLKGLVDRIPNEEFYGL